MGCTLLSLCLLGAGAMPVIASGPQAALAVAETDASIYYPGPGSATPCVVHSGSGLGSIWRMYHRPTICGYYYRPAYNYHLQFDYPWHPVPRRPTGCVVGAIGGAIGEGEVIQTPPVEGRSSSSPSWPVAPASP